MLFDFFHCPKITDPDEEGTPGYYHDMNHAFIPFDKNDENNLQQTQQNIRERFSLDGHEYHIEDGEDKGK